jgi:hypothetical protein
MSDVITGNPAHITTPLSATVAGTSSGTGGVIVVDTTAPHLFGPGDRVVGYGVGGTTEANGSWVITVIDTTHFSLNGSTFVHAWTSGGTFVDNSLTPQIQVETDGDTFSAQLSGLLSSQEALMDRTQYLQSKVGVSSGYYLAALGTGQIGPAGGVVWTATSYQNLIGNPNGPVQLAPTLGNVVIGDIVEVVVMLNAQVSNTSGVGAMYSRIEYTIGSATNTTAVATSEEEMLVNTATGVAVMGVMAMTTMITATIAGGMAIYVNGKLGSTAQAQMNISGTDGGGWTYKVWRAVGT